MLTLRGNPLLKPPGLSAWRRGPKSGDGDDVCDGVGDRALGGSPRAGLAPRRGAAVALLPPAAALPLQRPGPYYPWPGGGSRVAGTVSEPVFSETHPSCRRGPFGRLAWLQNRCCRGSICALSSCRLRNRPKCFMSEPIAAPSSDSSPSRRRPRRSPAVSSNPCSCAGSDLSRGTSAPRSTSSVAP